MYTNLEVLVEFMILPSRKYAILNILHISPQNLKNYTPLKISHPFFELQRITEQILHLTVIG